CESCDGACTSVRGSGATGPITGSVVSGGRGGGRVAGRCTPFDLSLAQNGSGRGQSAGAFVFGGEAGRALHFAYPPDNPGTGGAATQSGSGYPGATAARHRELAASMSWTGRLCPRRQPA